MANVETSFPIYALLIDESQGTGMDKKAILCGDPTLKRQSFISKDSIPILQDYS